MYLLIFFLVGAWGYLSPGVINTTVFTGAALKHQKVLYSLILSAAIAEMAYFMLAAWMFTGLLTIQYLDIFRWFAALCVLGIGIWTIIEAIKGKIIKPSTSVKRAYVMILLHPQQFPFWLGWFALLGKPDQTVFVHWQSALAAGMGCLMMLTIYYYAGKRLMHIWMRYPKQLGFCMGILYCMLAISMLLWA